MGCLKNILLLTALFVFSPFLSIEARGGIHVSRESEYLSRWAKYNQTDQYDSVIVAARPVLDSALLRGDSSTALMLSVMTAQAYMFTEREDSARYWIHMAEQECTQVYMAEQECTQVYAARNLESETQYRIVAAARYADGNVSAVCEKVFTTEESQTIVPTLVLRDVEAASTSIKITLVPDKAE